MSEIWKSITNYENYYEISNTGKVRSISREVIVKNKYGAISTRKTKTKELKPLLRGAYYIVWLCKGDKLKQYSIHRLVAETFIENKNNLSQVNHKDENKLNNCVDNLEWCSGKYNCNYGNRNKIISNKNSKPRKNFKRIAQFDKKHNLIKVFQNIYEAYKETNKNMTHIKLCCDGKRKMAGNYIWEYI